MKQITSKDIITPELSEGYVKHFHEPFALDYKVLHCLLRIHKPVRFLEIGTNIGTGTQIIKKALGKGAEVMSLDLPKDLKELSQQYPIDEVGSACRLSYTQLFGDSLKYDYSRHYPIHGWWIDGEHDYKHAYHESRAAIASDATIIIWHDADILPVNAAIVDAFKMPGGESYQLFRVTDTRIAYALYEPRK